MRAASKQAARERREAIFARFNGSISIKTDGKVVQLSGTVSQPRQPWLAKNSNQEVKLIADTLIAVADRLDVDLPAELERRIEKKAKLPVAEQQQFRVLDTEELWNYIKVTTPLDREDWAAAVFGGPDPARVEAAHAEPSTFKTYPELKQAQLNGQNWCRQSAVHGMLPSHIITELRNVHFDDVTAFYMDPGLVNVVAGVFRHQEDGARRFQRFRLTGSGYHHRTGQNRLRDRRERQPALGLSWAERASVAHAKQRHAVDEGKRQYFHEALAAFRMQADRFGDGRDFVVVYETSFSGGGRAHRQPACNEFKLFLAQFVLVATMSGYNTSQFCNRCGERLQQARRGDGRSKVCKSAACTTGRGKAWPFRMDRDTNAALNFALIDEAEARGDLRPERFQSDHYKKRLNTALRAL
jgi:hypothetical protein